MVVDVGLAVGDENGDVLRAPPLAPPRGKHFDRSAQGVGCVGGPVRVFGRLNDVHDVGGVVVAAETEDEGGVGVVGDEREGVVGSPVTGQIFDHCLYVRQHCLEIVFTHACGRVQDKRDVLSSLAVCGEINYRMFCQELRRQK